VSIRGGKAYGIKVPEVAMGDGRVRVSAEEGKIDVEGVTFEGGDLGVDFKGSLLLREDVSRSLINGVLSLRPSDKVAKELAMLFALFPTAKASDGRYTARVRGSLDSPRLLKR
jgi:type II secretion system protein N